MEKVYFSLQQDGFNGVYYPCREKTDAAVILMMGESCENRMAKSGAKWLQSKQCNVLVMSTAEQNYSFREFPIERVQKAIDALRHRENRKFGFMGISATGMAALACAACLQEISLTMALTPCDFVMESYYREKGREYPGNFQSSLSWQGKPLPFLPYVWRGNDYWENVMADSKQSRNMAASIGLFEQSEAAHPIQEEELLKVENIRGTLVFVGAEDDCMWNTCKYIRRMEKRLQEKGSPARCHYLLYQHGTHFVFPEGMAKKMLPAGASLAVGIAFSAGRKFGKECSRTRRDIDCRLTKIIADWQAES